MSEPLPRGSLRAGTEALRAYGDRGGTDEHAARLVLEAALPIIVRDARRQLARQISALGAEEDTFYGEAYKVRSLLRRAARGECLPAITGEETPDAH